MDAIRCTACGDVRWSLLGLKGSPGACQICGGAMAPERRRPDIGSRRSPGERRDLLVAARPAPGHRAGVRPPV